MGRGSDHDTGPAPAGADRDAEMAPLAGSLREVEVTWSATASVFVPFQARVGDAVWALRLNDFPAQPLYTLFVDGRPAGSIDDPPPAWRMPTGLARAPVHRLVPWAAELARRARDDD